jgi:hypothetical protein
LNRKVVLAIGVLGVLLMMSIFPMSVIPAKANSDPEVTCTGWVTAGTGGNETSVGTNQWSNSSAVIGTSSWAKVGLNPSQISYYVTGTHFGFKLAANATVTGVEVKYVRQDATRPPNGGVEEYAVRLIVNGDISGNNEADSSLWQKLSAQTKGHGSPFDLWNLPLTGADIDNEDFGFCVSATGINGSYAEVQLFQMNIYYSVLTGVTASSPTIDHPSNVTYTLKSASDEYSGMITWDPNSAIPDEYIVTRNGVIINGDSGVWYGGEIDASVRIASAGVYTYVLTVNDTLGNSANSAVVITILPYSGSGSGNGGGSVGTTSGSNLGSLALIIGICIVGVVAVGLAFLIARRKTLTRHRN